FSSEERPSAGVADALRGELGVGEGDTVRFSKRRADDSQGNSRNRRRVPVLDRIQTNGGAGKTSRASKEGASDGQGRRRRQQGRSRRRDPDLGGQGVGGQRRLAQGGGSGPEQNARVEARQGAR